MEHTIIEAALLLALAVFGYRQVQAIRGLLVALIEQTKRPESPAPLVQAPVGQSVKDPVPGGGALYRVMCKAPSGDAWIPGTSYVRENSSAYQAAFEQTGQALQSPSGELILGKQ